MYKKDTRETHHKNEKGRTEDINTQMMIRWTWNRRVNKQVQTIKDEIKKVKLNARQK